MAVGLFGEELIISTSEKTRKILNKVKAPKELVLSFDQQLRSKRVSLQEKIELITLRVRQILGKQEDNIAVIKTTKDFYSYISAAIQQDIIAIDTETDNSLDPLTCKLMGLCLYTPGQKRVYIPVNHIDPETRERLSWQLTEQEIYSGLAQLVNSQPLIVMQNAKFDYQVLKKTCDIEVPCYWDTMIAAKLIDENEQAGLKQQYILHINPEQEKYSIDSLFEKIEYAVLPPEVFALYAAMDPYMTYELYRWQKIQMEQPDFKKIYKLFREVEMPCIRVIAEMKLTGIGIDEEYAKRLSIKYNKKLIELDEKINTELAKYQARITAWRASPQANLKSAKKSGDGTGKSKAEQLADPISLGSPTQLAILLYDILGVASVSKKTPRGTGEDILKNINLPICELILERRGIVKLLDAFIESLPLQVNPVDNRIHCDFNQYGANTGRFSSSNPNMQQIPAFNKEIRLIFKAKEGYTFVASDFSQQEPRLLSEYSGDENMIKAYQEGKDLYATIASSVYNNSYWDNMEHYQDGTPNPDGKKRRRACKTLLLSIMYGQGLAAVAEQIGGTTQDAQKIINNFYLSFPKVKAWMDETIAAAKKSGYVEDLWGRRRRLPDIKLSPFEVKDLSPTKSKINPFLNGEVTLNPIVTEYLIRLERTWNRQEIDEIIADAARQQIFIKYNGGFIAQAERQCVNARIQGGAATMTKIAMNKIFRDPELNSLGFKLLLTVHDELIGECPKEVAEHVASRLTYIMKTCVEDTCKVPFSCDADICDHWYYNDYAMLLQQEYKELLAAGLTPQDARQKVYMAHTESTEEMINEILNLE